VVSVGQSQPFKLEILIVDDDPEVLEIARANLEREGYTIHAATSGPAALCSSH
jgi:CheY-like chemotaxis protein